jgi:hypothetical protein
LHTHVVMMLAVLDFTTYRELSIPQLVAELSRLIHEKWEWNVTQQDKHSFHIFFQDKHSFLVPFPSHGDLQSSVTFDNLDIKEHGVSLLFEEWKHVERTDSHYRVWITMLGATQSVDMISTLRNNYDRAEVAVLNVDLLPNIIDTVVIGDRMFSLLIQLEGLDDVAALDLYGCG